MLRVNIQTQGGTSEVREFPETGAVSFGRAPDNDIVLPAHYVSRAHGCFVRDADGWHVVCVSEGGLVVTKDGEHLDVSRDDDRRYAIAGGESVRILTTRIDVEEANGSALPAARALGADEELPIAFSQVIDVGSLHHELQKESRRLEIILDLAKDLNRLTDLDDVLRRIGTAVFQALPVATHFLVNVRSGERFAPRFGALRGGAELSLSQVSVSRSILRLVVEREMAMVFHRSDDGVAPSSSMIIHNIASSMAVPLRGGKGIVGVMQIDNRATEAPFSPEDLDLIVVLAHSAAFALERAQLQARIQHMFEGFVDASVTAIESRDPTTSGHSRRVARNAVALAEAAARCRTGPFASCTFTDDELVELAYAGLLHDFGKVAVPEQVLVKANRLFPRQLAMVENRFAHIRMAYRNRLLTAHLQAGADAPPPDEGLRRIGERCAEIDRKMAAWLTFLREVDAAGRVDDKVRVRLEELARATFVDVDGVTRRFLEDDELEALCIPAGTLTAGERKAIESHVAESLRFLSRIPWPAHLSRIPDIVAKHHEKLDGSGYPNGLRAADVPTQVRLLTVVDIFDAVTASDRPYRAAMPIERGLDVLRGEARRGKLDPDVVALFIDAKLWEPAAVGEYAGVMRNTDPPPRARASGPCSA
ncbi:GAF domain-containing protein [bacterium]|nr:GAF domain-containing protein [bacterium]